MEKLFLKALGLLFFAGLLHGQEPGNLAFSPVSSTLFGYVETSGSLIFDDGAVLSGFSTVFRLKGEWRGSSPVSARMELVYRELTGGTNTLSLLNEWGMNPAPGIQAENPQDSFLEQVEIDHAWANAALGLFDISLGKMPLAWGNAWLYNPTDRLGAAASLTGRGAETGGTTALVPVFYPGGNMALEGTLVLKQRGLEGKALTGSLDPKNIPFGLRLKGYAAGFDVSLSVIREVWYTGLPGGYDLSVEPPVEGESWDRRWFLGADAIGQVGPLGLYMEGTLGLDSEDDFSRVLDLAAGVELNPGKFSLKAEYIRCSTGAADPEDYNPGLLFSGRSFFLARNYLFLYASRTFGDYLEITTAGILNLDDRSAMITAEAVYPFFNDFELNVSGTLPFGGRGTEYGLDYMNPELSLGLKASF